MAKSGAVPHATTRFDRSSRRRHLKIAMPAYGPSQTKWGTVTGAWESAKRAAEASLRQVGALAPLPGTSAGAA